MKKSILLFLLISLVSVRALKAQDEVEMLLDLGNDGESKVELKQGNTTIKAGKTKKFDLNKTTITINITRYKSSRLIKFYTEAKLDCDGIDVNTNTDIATTTVTITDGKFIDDKGRSYPIGSEFKLAVAKTELNWIIPTELDELSDCPPAVIDPPAVVDIKKGIPYYDALTLNTTTNLDVIKEILKFYINLTDTPDVDGKRIADSIRHNPYLAGFIKQLEEDTLGEKHGIFDLSNFSASGIGGLDVTNIADGFAKFLVKRAKHELTVAFFEKFYDYLRRPAYRDLQTVFPETYSALSIIGDEIYNYERYIQALRESFEKDLSALPEHLPTIIDNHPEFFEIHKDLAAILLSGCYVAGQLRDKTHPGDILQDYPAEYLDDLNRNWKGAIQTIQLLSSAIRDTASNKDSIYWVPFTEIKKMVKTPAFKIFLGLIYQQAKRFNENTGIAFQGVSLETLLTEIANNYDSTANFISRFAEKTNKLNTMIKNYQKPANDSLAIEQYYNYFKASLDLLKHCTQITSIPRFKKLINDDLAKSMHDYFDVAQSSGDLVLHISRRNYSGAIVNVSHIYEVIKVKASKKDETTVTASTGRAELKRARKKAIKEIKEADLVALRSFSGQAVVDSTLTAAQVATLNTPDSLEKIKVAGDVKNKLFKYGSYMAAIVQAKSSDEVEQTIEAFALPAGSFRIKRVSDFNVSLNAYVGLFLGAEKIKDLDSGNAKINVFGVTAPIGVSTSWGHRLLFFKTNAEWSTSIFVSLVDLGAVAAFRFKDDSTAQVPTIQLKDIVSPGIFLSIGIPKWPLSVNFGAQMGPNLRKVNNNDPTKPSNDYSNKTYWRYSVSVCVDIPLLNFYTRSE